MIAFNLTVYLIWYILIFLQLVNKSRSEMELKINYAPISLGKLRVWGSLHHSLNSMKDLGMDSELIYYFLCECPCEENKNVACVLKYCGHWHIFVLCQVHRCCQLNCQPYSVRGPFLETFQACKAIFVYYNWYLKTEVYTPKNVLYEENLCLY